MGIHLNIGVREVKRAFIALIIFELLLIAAFILHSISRYPAGALHELLDLDGEANLQTWLSSMQLFGIGGLLLAFSRQRGASGPARLEGPPSPLFFRVIGLGFIFLSLDETAQIHERITQVLAPVSWMPRFPGGHGIWILFYALAGLALPVIFHRDLLGMLARFRRETLVFLLGAVLMAAGGIGVEVAGYLFFRSGPQSGYYIWQVAVEELLELSGMSIVLLGAMLLALRRQTDPAAAPAFSPTTGGRLPRIPPGSERA